MVKVTFTKNVKFHNGRYRLGDTLTVSVDNSKHLVDLQVARVSDTAPLDLESKTNDELKAMLDAKGIEYKVRATKKELMQLLGVD
ncbi:hypothetical protein [Alkalihalophilus marmarensis]|uniref:hypothetical protein n=1 Tax=Alkalihalophilus marmarensis TaxID=521377 RepID=UPI002E22993E|nr:hypothetical protein [Alkalihalophilus marmarensis]